MWLIILLIWSLFFGKKKNFPEVPESICSVFLGKTINEGSKDYVKITLASNMEILDVVLKDSSSSCSKKRTLISIMEAIHS